MNNRDVIQCYWNSIKDECASNSHKQCAVGTDTVMKNALLRRSLDNVSVVMVGFHNFEHYCNTSTGLKICKTEDIQHSEMPLSTIENVKIERETKLMTSKAVGAKHFDFNCLI